jgi:hypothetical protein
MAKALEDQRRQPDIAALASEERVAMMIDREAVEHVDMKAPRGLDKALFHIPALRRRLGRLMQRSAASFGLAKPGEFRPEHVSQEVNAICRNVPVRILAEYSLKIGLSMATASAALTRSSLSIIPTNPSPLTKPISTSRNTPERRCSNCARY